MKCPACENDVPSGRTACTRCGAPFPSAGERPAAEAGFASGPTSDPRAGSPNPTTEPLPVTDWEAADERPWGSTPAPYSAPATDPHAAPANDPYADPANDPYSNPETGPYATSGTSPYAAPDTGPHTAPATDPYAASGTDPHAAPATGPYSAPDTAPYSAPEAAPYSAPDTAPYSAPDPAPYSAPDTAPYSAPEAAPYSAPADPYSRPGIGPYSAPGTDPYSASGSDPYAAPGIGPMPSEPDQATQNLGAPPVHRAPFEPGRPASPTGPQVPAPAYPIGPEPGNPGNNATQSFGVPGTGSIPPGAFNPAAWDQGIPPAGEDGMAPPPDEDVGKSSKTPLLVAGIAAVVVLGGGLVYVLAQGLPWSGDDATHTSTGKPAAQGAVQQAAAVNQVLKSGRTARGHLPAPLRTCDDVAAGVPGFQQVVRDRQQEVAQSKGLKVDQLKDGARLRRSMITAYQRSLDADQAYLAWAQEIQGRGCGGKIAPLTAHYKAAISANGKAGPAKRQVVARWNPIAANHGLPTYVWNRL